MNNDYVESLLKSAIKEGVQDIYIIQDKTDTTFTIVLRRNGQ